ncbi:alanine dehydrogenase [Desulfosporosinus sp. BICA1-9]|uniref:alanine dehydrogenase n=1 Tax=Desulfosporosinus sp. BICA1-9 TaxID=1531958 RepID=UPI00054B18D0|nr:alanine dehydrogenase [Desulfosporosinus sp. BICA1-9]KJS50054.1 MAG: alanine dehydrogenase [Peptococcaceae bacterium BRH_c23]KJS89103.1 MAG: alanine dehydrogenase [Desulfosporosinus sp. BICA1-9]HBW35281.1 alanine dehydrogenase [Desulfosporosinus sp.]
MIIGVPKEIKNNENRVALTPAGVVAFCKAGHQVVIENNAGVGSGISNEEYIAAGAEVLATPADVYTSADMIIKVKEPLSAEYDLFKDGQLLFTYLHLAPEPALTAALLKKNVVGIAYETVQPADGSLPLLIPMSEVAGRMATQIGAQFLEKQYGGKGILLGGVPGVSPAKVTIVGGGIVGINAAKMAIGMGAEVTILDVSNARLRYLDDIFSSKIKTLMSNSYNIAQAVAQADLLVGAVLIPGARAPKLVTEEMVKAMKPGSVIVDVAIDQGGSVETIDHVTTHAEPTYEKFGVIHYSVANMPGAVARTSTFALTNATLPYALKLAKLGYAEAIRTDLALARGVNVIHGKLTYKAVAEALNLEYTPLSDVTEVPSSF